MENKILGVSGLLAAVSVIVFLISRRLYFTLAIVLAILVAVSIGFFYLSQPHTVELRGRPAGQQGRAPHECLRRRSGRAPGRSPAATDPDIRRRGKSRAVGERAGRPGDHPGRPGISWKFVHRHDPAHECPRRGGAVETRPRVVFTAEGQTRGAGGEIPAR